MYPHVISFYGFTSRIRFMFLLVPQVSRNWRYESEPPLKPSPLTPPLPPAWCLMGKGKFKISLKSKTKTTGSLHEDPDTLVIITRSVLLRKRNVPYESYRENQNTHFAFYNFLSNIVPFMRKCGKILYRRAGHRWQYGACALHARYLRPPANAHSEYVILFLIVQWLRERTWILLFTFGHHLVLHFYKTTGVLISP